MHRFLAVIVLLVVGVSRGMAQVSPPPNILLIVSDDQRPDTIRALGNHSIDTPHLDRLVREGAVFPRAITANPHCTPSRAEIITGATGFRNGSSPFGKVMNPEMVFWGTTMRKAGYHAWYCGKWMNDGSPKTRGYEETRALYSSGGAGGRENLTYPKAYNGGAVTGYTGWTFKTDDGKPELAKGVGLTPITDAHIADGAIEFLRRRSDKPFFLHVNFTAPHDPLHFPPGYEEKYDAAAIPLPPNFMAQHPFDHGNAGTRDEVLLPLPRDPRAVKAEIAAYYALISHMDAQIGRIMETLRSTGQEKNTVVIFTSDHGLAKGSHGLLGKQNMYEHTLGVPLIMAGPGIPRNERLMAQTYLRDLYPTVCELAGIPIPPTVEGRSLNPVLSGRTGEIYPEIYAYWHGSPVAAAPDALPVAGPIQRMVRTDRWKLIYYSHLDRYQLFDLKNDPFELKDLSTSPDQHAVLAGLKSKLSDWFTPRTKSFNPTSDRRKGNI